MDGTLLDSRKAVELAWQQWSVLESIDFGDLETAHGRPARELLAERVPLNRLDSSLQLLQQLEEHPSATIPILSGATTLLERLPSERWAIVTSSTGSVARARITHSGLLAPARLITADDVSSGKPDPEPFVFGARALGLDASDCIAFEDSRAGLISAKRAGCFTVAIIAGRPLVGLTEWADICIDSLDAVTVEIQNDRLVLDFAPDWEGLA